MPDSGQTFPHSIIVGSDLSEASDRVVRQAALVAKRGRAELHVVSAYAPPQPVSAEGEEPPPGVMAEVRGALPAQLRRILSDEQRPTSAEVRFGPPARVLLERAQEVEARVIVLGAHRGRDVNAQFLGTTADEVLRLATVPCLTLRGTVALPLRNVGVATDFSAVGKLAIACALEWAAWLGSDSEASGGATVRAVHVLPPGEAAAASECRRRLEGELRERPTEVDQPGVRADAEVLMDGDVASALVRWADSLDVDLLVIGTHGKSGWQRSTLGSISSALARRATCPVLLVPARGAR